MWTMSTLIALKDKVKKIICGLGVGAHFESWGYPSNKIIEKDWHDKIELDNGFIALHRTGPAFFRQGIFKKQYTLAFLCFANTHNEILPGWRQRL